jgi:hypothetical protein
MQKLNKNKIYGTHYVNIIWEGESITKDLIKDKKKILNYFCTNKYLESVVGNFILTHKLNWLKAGGYDESLRDVRAGVDNDALKQLLTLGFKPMVLGNHYHLHHAETSITGYNPTHGNNEVLNNRQYPYHNHENWGLVNFKEVLLKERIWQIEKI